MKKEKEKTNGEGLNTEGKEMEEALLALGCFLDPPVVKQLPAAILEDVEEAHEPVHLLFLVEISQHDLLKVDRRDDVRKVQSSHTLLLCAVSVAWVDVVLVQQVPQRRNTLLLFLLSQFGQHHQFCTQHSGKKRKSQTCSRKRLF